MKVIKIKFWENIIDGYNYFFTGVAIDIDNDFCFYKNGKYHRENGYTQLIKSKNFKDFLYFYKDAYYGKNEDFTNKSWKKFVKKLKREEKLRVFI